MGVWRVSVVKRKRMTGFQAVLAMLLATFAVAAQAQPLPNPKEFYFDTDQNASLIVVVEGEGEALAQGLVRARERGRRATEATAQLAHVGMQDNRIELGKQLYAEAMRASPANAGTGRAVRWNYAWDLYRLGEYQPALELWAELAGGFGSPSWLPPTLALSLWSVDRKVEAVQWYAAAVRTEPRLWTDPANYPALLPGWRPQDRARLAEVFDAWQNDPPAWP